MLIVVGCAPVTKQPQITSAQAQKEAELQAEMAVRRIVAMNERANAIYHPIRKANAELCGDMARYTLGVPTQMLQTTTGSLRDAYARLYGVNERHPAVVAVVKGSNADRAGIRQGDVLWGLGGIEMRPGNLVAAINGPGPWKLDILRAGQPLQLEVGAEKVCGYPLSVSGIEAVNAYADGKEIVITAGMMRFVESDAELALVLSHEMAHNTMDHLGKQRGNEFVGVLIGAVIQGVVGGYGMTDLGAQAGRAAFGQEFEGEADYVGVYYAARAGYDVSNAAQLWRRMGVVHPASIHLEGSTHPSTAKRFMAIEETVKEIDGKRSRGEALVPDMKEEVGQ
ncbi:MAG: M48 family metalloprotease [Magnetospirillum sp.]|nr:M48 family metalloprotease [Magnetospirillum sp.]